MTGRPTPAGHDAEAERAAWFDQPGPVGPPSPWRRYQDWIIAAVIVVVVIGLGAWDIIAGGPIHPHV